MAYEQQLTELWRSYDAIFLRPAEKLVQTFLEFDVQILFSADTDLWPDRSLADQYPGQREAPSAHSR